MQRISKSLFGTHEGKPVHLFRLANAHGMSAEIIEYGGRIKGLSLPVAGGGSDNLSVGFNDLDSYVRFNPWFGALIGRTASRITGASFAIDGTTYTLTANGPGGSNMHGGAKGFDKVVWSGNAFEDASGATLELTYTSPDGEEGYPGELKAKVTYRLDDDNRFHMNWEAVTNAPTIVDMTSHVYLNLNGVANADIRNLMLRVNASRYLEKDATGTPTGVLSPVEGSPFDLRSPKRLGDLASDSVYNPIMALDGEGLREVAKVELPARGRAYSLFTTGRALQVFNAATVPDFFKNAGLDSPYGPFPGLCIEPQNYPNAINIPSFPAPILRPGERYAQQQYFAFSW